MRVSQFALVGMAVALAAACRPTPPVDIPDGRTVLVVPPEAAHAVRSEMRTMLAALQAIVAAAPTADTATIRGAARSAGMAAAADTALEALLPESFMRLGVATHQGFDSLAAVPGTLVRTDTILAHVGRIMANCVSCHSQFRLQLGPGTPPN